MSDSTKLSAVDKSLVDAFWAHDRKTGDYSAIEAALKNGANPNLTFGDDDVTSNGNLTPLGYAALAENSNLFETLLDYGADIFGENDINTVRYHYTNIELFTGADRSVPARVAQQLTDCVLSKMRVGSADVDQVKSVVEDIRAKVLSLGEFGTVAEQEIVNAFRQLQRMGVTFGGSKKVAVGSEAAPAPSAAPSPPAAAPAPHVSATGAEVQPRAKGSNVIEWL